MPEADRRPILARSLTRRVSVPGNDGGVIGWNDVLLARRLTIPLTKGKTEYRVGPENRTFTETTPGVYAEFEGGNCEVSAALIDASGLSRAEIVAILTKASIRDGVQIYELLTENAATPVPEKAKK